MRVLRAIPAILILVLASCGINNVNISISPSQATVITGAQLQFSASVGNAGNKTVTWFTTGGTITDTGLFTAPSTRGIYSVVVTSQADPSQTATAVVTVMPSVVITPASATLLPLGTQDFTAVLPDTNDTNVRWSVLEGDGGSIQTNTDPNPGRYTAPDKEGIFTVKAVSEAHPSRYAIAYVTVLGPVAVVPNSVTMTVSNSTATPPVLHTQTFTGYVRANSADDRMIWSMQPGSLGTIDATTGVYTAPDTAGTYYVVATSYNDHNLTGRALVMVNPAPLPIKAGRP